MDPKSKGILSGILWFIAALTLSIEFILTSFQ